jgi:hypothetical protein
MYFFHKSSLAGLLMLKPKSAVSGHAKIVVSSPPAVWLIEFGGPFDKATLLTAYDEGAAMRPRTATPRANITRCCCMGSHSVSKCDEGEKERSYGDFEISAGPT